jgi:hypothetical protein
MAIFEQTQPVQARYLDSQHLAAGLRQALQETLFASGLLISPRQVGRIAQEIASSFLQFSVEEHAATRAYGQRLAQDGLGHASILAISECLCRVCRESGDAGCELSPVAERYNKALLEGYMGGREADLLLEQEKTLQAYERAREQNKHGDIAV